MNQQSTAHTPQPKGMGIVSRLIRAAAPIIPRWGRTQDAAIAQPLPPFSHISPPVVSPALDERAIFSDPRDNWALALPDMLTPKQVANISRSALAGDIWQQWQLISPMYDSWPMFRKCAHEIRSAVSQVTFKVTAHTDKAGADSTPSAKAKADLVSKAIKAFKPNGFNDERGWTGTVYDLTDAWINGISMGELIWYRNDDLEWMPRASAWIHPRHFAFGNDGNLAVFQSMYSRLSFTLAQPMTTPDSAKFLCAQAHTRTGSALSQGLARPLFYEWSSMVWARQWKLSSAERYGNPIIKGSYQGLDTIQLAQFEQFLKNAAASGYVMYPNGCQVEIVPASNLGPDNRQVEVIRQANENCQILLLGQVGTTTSTPGKLGGQDGTHENVKREVVESVAGWVAETLTTQFARAVINLNYPPNEQNEYPIIEADFTEPADPLMTAQRYQILAGQNSPPVCADEYYRDNQLRIPDETDLVVWNGQVGLLKDLKQAKQDAADALQQAPAAPGDDKAKEKIGASVRAALKRATPEQVKELKQLSEAALNAPHVNGEVALVRSRLKEIGETKR